MCAGFLDSLADSLVGEISHGHCLKNSWRVLVFHSAWLQTLLGKDLVLQIKTGLAPGLSPTN